MLISMRIDTFILIGEDSNCGVVIGTPCRGRIHGIFYACDIHPCALQSDVPFGLGYGHLLYAAQKATKNNNAKITQSS
jgi:hypothetical protein